jgi:hypothetical protein
LARRLVRADLTAIAATQKIPWPRSVLETLAAILPEIAPWFASGGFSTGNTE